MAAKKSAAPAKVVTFTPDELKTLQDAAAAVWDYVAGDYLALTEGKPVPRAEVIEVVLDAGRLEDHLSRIAATATRRGMKSVITDDLVERVRKADYPTMIAAVKPAFKYRSYGL